MTTTSPDISADAVKVAPKTPATDSWIGRVTVEQLAYGLLIVLTFTIRLAYLGVRPLSPVEASTALRAWQASRGLEPALDAGIPLLFSLDWLTFFLTGTGDGLVRIWPLLASVGIILAMYQWRSWLGRIVTLLATTLFVLSPLLNAFGRRGDGAALVLLGLALALAGWGRLQRSDVRGWMLVAIGSGVMLISGPAAPTALLALALIMMLTWRSVESIPSPTLSHFLAFLTVVLVGGTAFLTHLSGLGLVALNWGTWFAAFTASPGDWLWGLFRLLLDEPFLILVGLTGLVLMLLALRRTHGDRIRLALQFAVVALIIMLVAILQGPYPADSRAVAAFLMTVPAATFLLWLSRLGHFRQIDAEMGLYAIVFFVLIALGVFALISYTHSGDATQLWLLAASVVMAIALTAVFVYFLDKIRVLSLAALVIVIALMLFNLSVIGGIAFDVKPPRFPALYEKDARLGVYDLVGTAGDLSERETGYRWALPISLVTGGEADDLLQWYLREASVLHLVDSVSLETATPLVIAPVDRSVPLTERYAGQDFAILDAWDPAQGDLQQQINWALFRNAPWLIPTENYILWADAEVLSLE